MGSGVLTSLNYRIITNINKYKTMFKLSQINPFTIQAVMYSAFKKLLKRIIAFILFMIMMCIACFILILAVPVWIITGKEILNSSCDWMLLKIILFLED